MSQEQDHGDSVEQTLKVDDDDLFASAVQSPLTESAASPPPPRAAPEPEPEPERGPELESTHLADATAEISLEDDESEPTVSGAPRLALGEPEPAARENGAGRAQISPQEDELERQEEDDQFIQVQVVEPVKIGDGMSSYMAYKVTTKTNVSYFTRQHFSVMRRFSDFLGLHDKLVEKHIRSGRIVPPAPEKSVIGTTKIKIGSGGGSGGGGGGGGTHDHTGPNEFIERRRAALERYLNRTAAHPTLRADPDFREFLELDAELPRATQTSALSSAGVLRLFNRVGETVSKIAFKMDESDVWFEERVQQVESLDGQLRKLHGSVEALVLYRRELASSTAQLARAAAMLSNVEEHTALSRALSQLSELQERVERLHTQQADNDFYMLAEMLKDYVMLLGAVKDVFHEREKLYQTWQHAQQTLTKKREVKARLELQGRSDKLQQLTEEVTEWEAKVERSQEEFERISRSIKKEMEMFDCNRVKDFKDCIVKYLETLMANQQKLVKLWETFLPEAKAIA
ncbi:sorting nexin-2-like isoform X2 [Pollicipes pollicipes]|uniref:sorting nexin-2-like isoform X2 n=1 Tax=Pollicipes pollicipes TaxID=41117 RepID=UPI001885142B|nr:sorting nexin-2-like isoform X2 [Pollicipes pollicipes]